MIQDDLNSHDIKTVKVDGLELSRKYFMIYHKNKNITETMQRFMEVAKGIAK
jgi:hypothetical protein